MKTWFKKHWKDCLVIFIIVLIFGTMGYINYRSECQKEERRERTRKLLIEIEKGIDEARMREIKLIERCQPCLTGEKDD